MQALGADTGPCWISGPDPVQPVRAALAALGCAAQALAQHGGPRPASSPGSITGIDYLGLLATRHHQDLLRRLYLSDASHAAAAAAPWHQITIITGGRLQPAQAEIPAISWPRHARIEAATDIPAGSPVGWVALIGTTTMPIKPSPRRPIHNLTSQKPLPASASSTTPSSAR